jgi:hypothetical protein
MKKSLAILILVLLTNSYVNSQSFSSISASFSNLNTPFKYGSIDWGDYNNDGYLDILMTGYGTYAKTKIYKNNKNGTFLDLNISLADVYYSSAKWGDFDNDGDLDILISGSDVTKIYRNDGNDMFTDINANLVNLEKSSVAWGDFNNDGRLDVLVSGDDGYGNPVTKLYENEGNNIFTEINSNIIPVIANIALGDYDNDGNLDVLLTGSDTKTSNAITKIYRNDGNAVFTDINVKIPNYSRSSCAFGDYDNDGDLDILIAGTNTINISKIYRNDGNGIFTDVNANLKEAFVSSVAWFDYDNDGFLDALITGKDNKLNYYSKIYHNDGNDIFTEINAGLVGVGWSSVACGDYDNDGDLDLIINGLNSSPNPDSSPFTGLFKNNGTSINSNPIPPTNLQAKQVNNDVFLSWNKSMDNETGQKGLTYNIYIGVSPYSSEIISPMSILSTGKRTITRMGNANEDTTFKIKNLKFGKYYWSVQSIDNEFSGSPFAVVDSFNFAPSSSFITDLSKCKNDTINVTYNGNATNNANYYWDFDGGKIISGIGKGPYKIIWTNDGIKNISLSILENGVKSDTTYKSINIKSLPIVMLGNDLEFCDNYAYSLTINSTFKKYNWNNGLSISNPIKITKSGDYFVIVTDSNNCSNFSDTINIKFNPTYSFNVTQNVCNGDSILWRGNFYKKAGIYSDSLYTILGCDSIYQLTLKVNPVYYFIENKAICNGSNLLWHNKTLNSNGIYFDSLLTKLGCDSVYELHLNINPIYHFPETKTICDGDSYLWHGKTYKTKGLYFDKLLTKLGCDSIFELQLNVNPSYTFTSNEAICSGDSLLWRGNYYKSTKTYYDSLLTIYGCDSIIKLNLKVNPIYHITEQKAICNGDSLLWQGNYYKTDGTYYNNLSTKAGCDSIRELKLSVNPTYSYSENKTICNGETFFWHGKNYNTQHLFYDSLLTKTGCDSIFELNLTVNPTFHITEQKSICKGESYVWRGKSYNTSGTFYDSLLTINSCDSIYKLELKVNILDTTIIQVGNVLTANAINSNYQWYSCDSAQIITGFNTASFSAIQSGNYSVIVSQNNCSDTSSCINIIISGINELFKNQGIKLYPNPSNGIITIEGEQIKSIKIVDLNGKTIRQFSIIDKKKTIDLHSCSKGIYILKVETDNGIFDGEIILK